MTNPGMRSKCSPKTRLNLKTTVFVCVCVCVFAVVLIMFELHSCCSNSFISAVLTPWLDVSCFAALADKQCPCGNTCVTTAWLWSYTLLHCTLQCLAVCCSRAEGEGERGDKKERPPTQADMRLRSSISSSKPAAGFRWMSALGCLMSIHP